MRLILAVLVTAVVAVLIAVPVALLGRRRAASGGRRSGVEVDLLARLTEEVRAWRAEAEHWQRTAVRLQGELDSRPGAPPAPTPPERPGMI